MSLHRISENSDAERVARGSPKRTKEKAAPARSRDGDEPHDKRRTRGPVATRPSEGKKRIPNSFRGTAEECKQFVKEWVRGLRARSSMAVWRSRASA